MNKYIIASSLLDLWEDAARRLAPDEHLRWHQRLEGLPDDVKPRDLRNALMPLVAKSDKEQDLFCALFAEAEARVLSGEHLYNDDPGSLQTVQTSPESPLLVAATAYLLLALLGAVLWMTWQPAPPPVVPPYFKSDFILAPRQKTTFQPSGLLRGEASRITRFTLDSVNGQPPDTAPTALDSISISSDTVVHVAARDTIGLTDTLLLGVVFPDSTTGKLLLRISIARIGGGSERKIIPDARELSEQPFVNHDDRLQALKFEPDNTLPAVAPFIRIALLFLLALALYWYLRLRARNRKKLVAERDKTDKPPYVWNIRLDNLTPPDPGEAFSQTLNSMRRRTETESRKLDMTETVQATVRKAGMAEFRYQQLTQPPEYLLLIEQRGGLDHRTRLLDDLYRAFVANDIIAERFFFDGQAQLFWNDQYTDGVTYEELYLRYPHHRLMLFSAGRQLFSTGTGKLAKWTSQIARWKDRALLTPLPAAEWGRRERILASFFRFAPASLPGMRRVLEDFESDAVTPGTQLDKLAPLAPGEPVLLENGDLIATLEKQYPDPLTRRWLAAMALWPELHYDLSLWLGHQLSQESGETVVTMSRLNDLLRLPWFARGIMPDPARADLIDWLRKENPGLEANLRRALFLLMEKNGPPGDSAAWDAYAMRVAFNEWMICNDPVRKKELENRIAAWMDENPDTDLITVRELNGPPGPLDNLLPDSWKKRLFKGKLPGLGLRDGLKDLLGIALPVWTAAALSLWLGWQPREIICSGSLETVVTASGNIPVCDDTDEKKLLIREYKLRNAAARQDSLLFDSLLRQKIPWIPDTILAKEITQNIATAAFNAGIPAWMKAEMLLKTQPGFNPDTSLIRHSACHWFALARQADSLHLYARAGESWCARTLTPTSYPCYRITGKNTFLLNRDPMQRELASIGRYRDALIATLQAGQTVELLDSTPTAYKVRCLGTDGFIARGNISDPAVEPCSKSSFREPGGSDTSSVVLLPDMVQIPGGTFFMGSTEEDEDAESDEKPRHEVTVSSFNMSATEVTLGQFRSFVKATGYITDAENAGWSYCFNGSRWEEKSGVNWRHDERGRTRKDDRYPVIHVSWNDAVAYCNWLSEIKGLEKVYVVDEEGVTVRPGASGFHLPTEAQWEYAAGNGSRHSKYSWGDGPPRDKKGGNVADETAREKFPDWIVFEGYNDGYLYAAPVGSFDPNDFGLYDMSGNVWEWCEDWYGEYEAAAQTDPRGPEKGVDRVDRGGSWDRGPRDCRAAYRGLYGPSGGNGTLGFRLAVSLQ